MAGRRALPADRAAHRRSRWIVPAAITLAVLAAAGFGLRAQAVDAPRARDGSVHALMLSGSSLSHAEAQRTAEELGWQADVYTLPGAGISRSAHDPSGSITKTARAVLPAPTAPDVVVIQGGEADHVASAEVLERATQHLIDYVRVHAGPQATVVLVGPIPGGTVPASTRAVNDVLSAVAQQRGIVYLDAVAAGWQARSPSLPTALADAIESALTSR